MWQLRAEPAHTLCGVVRESVCFWAQLFAQSLSLSLSLSLSQIARRTTVSSVQMPRDRSYNIRNKQYRSD